MNSTTLHHPTTTLHLTTSSNRHRSTPFLTPSAASRRRHLRPLPTTTSTNFLNSLLSPPPLFDNTLQSQNYLNTLLIDSKLYLNQFIESSQDAIEDLKTLIVFYNRNDYNSSNNSSFDHSYSYSYGNSSGQQRVLVSCKRSTVEFLGGVLISSFVVVYTVRVVLKIGKVLFFGWRGNGGGEGKIVYKRDRSLGGKLVAVGSSDGEYRSGSGYGSTGKNDESFWDWSVEVKEWRRERAKGVGLPKWWPKENVVSGIGGMMDEDEKKEYQNLANRFIRAMMDNRLRGKDITEDDIIQLRRMCKTYGLKVSIDTANSRDSLYRTSVNFVLDHCEKQANESASVQIGYEDVQQFIAGLANNIGLEDTRAVKMVSAAVAARTRSRFLQAWALEMQGKRSEAVSELQKVCFIHKLFPPEEYSPEMEMVARGLNNHLKEDQRESLMNTLTSICGEETPRSLIEALGLIQ
ncbi:hypothetical protein Leryth_004439 [Lithospermum erythrorhizon]|nr:hypothetical protein Leryth_004439 [Lithospermum erythrorhizon]